MHFPLSFRYITLYMYKILPCYISPPDPPLSPHTHTSNIAKRGNSTGRLQVSLIRPSLSLSLRSLVKFVFECVLYRHGEILYYYYYIPVYIIKENVIVDDDDERENEFIKRA